MKSLIVASKKRSQKGQAVAIPMLMLGLMVVIVIGMFSFEIARTAIARDQLRTATEAASLAGAATLAGSTDSDITTSQKNAIAAAKKIFQQNEIFGVSLSSATEGKGPPKKEQAFLEFQFVDPQHDNKPVPMGDPLGKALEVKSIYGLSTVAGRMIGLGDNTSALEAQATGGVGQLDVVFCFDCSGSMRFHTYTTNVRRLWNPTLAKVEYVETAHEDYSPAGGMRPQQITSLNALLRGASDNSFPGNFPPGIAPPTGYTDIVVNFNEQKSFTGFSEGGFDFPDVGTLVEASRGNLEDAGVFASSGAISSLTGKVTPKQGYQKKYFELCRKHTHPWVEAEQAAQEFFTLMSNNTRAHFGLVAFSQNAGQDESTGFTDQKVGSSYPPGGSEKYPLPAISLKLPQAQTNANEVKAAVGTLVPDGNTNIGAAIERANRMFDKDSSRPNAKRAIVLFTDGIPSAGQPLSGDPLTNCRLAAQQSKTKGVAIYAVGLALDPSELQQQNNVLSMITTTAGNGGQFFQVTNASNLNKAFAAIARNLTQIVQ